MSIFCRNEEILILINNMKIYKNDNNDMVNKLYIILSISVWPHTFVSPSAFQEGQLSVTGESMCTKYWLTA